MLSGAPPHDPAKYDGDHNRPRIAARLIRPTKSCRNRLDETPLSELTRAECCGPVPAWVSEAEATLRDMRFRLYPSAAQEVLLLGQCGHARFVWNLGLEQRLMWARWKGPTPGFNAQAAQLTAARAAEPWLACGSQTIQQQALRDLDQAWTRFFAGTHRRPTWRKAGEHEGLRFVGPQGLRVRC